MQQNQENEVTMIEVVLAHLDKHQAIWASLPSFATHVNTLKTKRNALAPHLNKQTQKTKGVTQDKKKLKTIAIQHALLASVNLEVYATDTNDNTLRENVHATKSSLELLPDTELTIRLQFLHDTANDLLAQMSNYGNTAQALQDFQAAITDYQLAVPKPRNTLVQKKTATVNISTTIKEAKAALRNLDKLMLNFAVAQPDFVSEYKNCRQVIDLTHHKTRLEITVTQPNNAPIYKATITLINTDTQSTYKITTDPNGIARFSDITKGSYTATLSAPNYQDHTENDILISAGKTTALHINLLPVNII